jgi:hypothetical protein
VKLFRSVRLERGEVDTNRTEPPKVNAIAFIKRVVSNGYSLILPVKYIW